MLDAIRRRFEMLRARRIRLHRRPDGDELDIDALVAARGEFAAGLPLPQNVYLEQVFGAGHYALLPRPDLLPRVLLDWLRHLVDH